MRGAEMPRGVYRRPKAASRFTAKTRREGECLVWTGTVSRDGYGMFWDGTKLVLAHRWAYENLVGPIPPGKQLDHRCRNRPCVAIAHLEPVTGAENTRRRPVSGGRRFSFVDVDR